MKKVYKIVTLFLAVLVLSSFVGCFAGDGSYEGNYSDYDEENSDIVVNSLNSDERKVLTTVNLTFYEEEENIKSLKETTEKELSGYEGTKILYDNHSKNSDGNYYFVKLVVKIPSNKVDDFIKTMKEKTEIYNENTSDIDVTEKYNSYVDERAKINEELSVYEDLYDEGSVTDKLEIIKRRKDLESRLKEIEGKISEYNGGETAFTKVVICMYTSDNSAEVSEIVFLIIVGLVILFFVGSFILRVVRVKKKRGNNDQNNSGNYNNNNNSNNFFS